LTTFFDEPASFVVTENTDFSSVQCALGYSWLLSEQLALVCRVR